MCCDIHILSYSRMCMDNIPSRLIIIVFGLVFLWLCFVSKQGRVQGGKCQHLPTVCAETKLVLMFTD